MIGQRNFIMRTIRQITAVTLGLLVIQCSSAAKKDAPIISQKIIPGIPGAVFIQRIQTDQQPKQVCFHPSRDEIYVTNLGGTAAKSTGPGSLQIFKKSTGELLFRQPAIAAVECLLDLSDENVLYYSDMFSDEIVKFDLLNRKVLYRASIKESNISNFRGTNYRYMPKIIEPDTINKRLYVSMWLDGVSVINSETGEFIRRFPRFCSHPRGLMVEKNTLFVMCYGVPDGPGEIVQLDTVTGQVISRLNTGGSPRHIVRISKEKALISNLNAGLIYLYDFTKGTIDKSLKTGAANTIVLDPGKEFVYVNDRSHNKIYIVSIQEWKILTTISTGPFPTGLDVSRDGRFLAVTNFDDASFDLFELKRGQQSIQ